MSLYDYGLGTLAQYELTADRSARTRELYSAIQLRDF